MYLKHILAIYEHIEAAILGVGKKHGTRERGRDRMNEEGKGKGRGEV